MEAELAKYRAVQKVDQALQTEDLPVLPRDLGGAMASAASPLKATAASLPVETPSPVKSLQPVAKRLSPSSLENTEPSAGLTGVPDAVPAGNLHAATDTMPPKANTSGAALGAHAATAAATGLTYNEKGILQRRPRFA